MAHIEVPSDPRERNAWIKYQLELNNCTFADIAREGGVSRSVVRRALVMKYPKWQAAIAAKIGLTPAEIWPERYAQL